MRMQRAVMSLLGYVVGQGLRWGLIALTEATLGKPRPRRASRIKPARPQPPTVSAEGARRARRRRHRGEPQVPITGIHVSDLAAVIAPRAM